MVYGIDYTTPCPFCKTICECDLVDVGVGMAQAGPYHCENCGASQIGPHDDERELTDEEQKTGWYKPGSEPGSSANVIGGKIVSHKVMQATYRREFLGNPLYEDKSYVDNWWKEIRKKS